MVIHHYQRYFRPLDLPGGYLAVDLFFLMSGVVLARAYERRLNAGLTPLGFMRLRLIRLYPLYLLGTGIGLLIAIAGLFRHNASHWDAKGLLASAVLGTAFLPDPLENPVNAIFPLDPPSWSLFFELLVNLLYAVFVPLLSSRSLLFVCVLSGVGVALTIATHGDIDVGHNLHHFVYGFARTIFGFSLGVLFARKIPGGPLKDGGARRMTVIFGAAAIALVGRPTGDLRAVWDATCVFAVFPIIVYFALRINPPRAWQPAVTFLGLTSYAIYALHVPLIGPIDTLLRISAVQIAPLAGFMSLGMLLLLSWLADRYFDTPVRRFLGRRFGGSKGRD